MVLVWLTIPDTHAFFSGLTIEQARSTILSGLVVAETELPSVVLEEHVPQLAIEMHGYAKALALVPSLSIWFVPLK